MSKSHDYIAQLLTKTTEQPDKPQNHWDKLPAEVRHMILDHFKYVHEPTELTLFDLYHKSFIEAVQIIDKHRRFGGLETDIFNIMRVNHQWYCDVTRRQRYFCLINFKNNWRIYKALEVLMTQPPKKPRKRVPKAVESENLETEMERLSVSPTQVTSD